MASRIRLAAVGLGWVALHRHLPVMDHGADFEVVGVVDSHAGRAEAVAQQRGYRRSACAAAVDEVSWLDEVDAVTVATAPMGTSCARSAGAGAWQARADREALHHDRRTRRGHGGGGGRRRAAARDRAQFSVRALDPAPQGRHSGRCTWRDHRHRCGPVRQSGPPACPTGTRSLPLGLFYDESLHLLYLMRSIAGRPPAGAQRRDHPEPARPRDAGAHRRPGSPAESSDYPIQLELQFRKPGERVVLDGLRGKAPRHH